MTKGNDTISTQHLANEILTVSNNTDEAPDAASIDSGLKSQNSTDNQSLSLKKRDSRQSNEEGSSKAPSETIVENVQNEKEHLTDDKENITQKWEPSLGKQQNREQIVGAQNGAGSTSLASTDADAHPSVPIHDSVHEEPSASSSGRDTGDHTKIVPLFMSRMSAVSKKSDPMDLRPSSEGFYKRILQALIQNEEIIKEVSFGKRVGFYRLSCELGHGNFSVVRKGTHIMTHDVVAVKIIDRRTLDGKAEKLMHQEIENLKFIRHNLIIQLAEINETSDKIHLILEYASGGDLQSRIANTGALSESKASNIFEQVTCAVEYLHTCSIVHRDIKAENIMFANEDHDHIKLGDLGFSVRVCAPDEHLTTFCGSPPYAAPELFEDPYYEGFFVDIWALGVLLYFMLFGSTPFMGSRISSIKAKVLAGVYDEIEGVSDDVNQLIASILVRPPTERLSIAQIKVHPWMERWRACNDPLFSLASLHSGIEDNFLFKPSEVTAILVESYGVPYDDIQSVVRIDKRFNHPITGLYRLTEMRLRDERQSKRLEQFEAELAARNGTQAGIMSPDEKELQTMICGLKTSNICTIL